MYGATDLPGLPEITDCRGHLVWTIHCFAACFVASVEYMGVWTENIADKAINDTRIVKQFTNPVKEPLTATSTCSICLDNRAKRDPEGAMIEYKGR